MSPETRSLTQVLRYTRVKSSKSFYKLSGIPEKDKKRYTAPILLWNPWNTVDWIGDAGATAIAKLGKSLT